MASGFPAYRQLAVTATAKISVRTNPSVNRKVGEDLATSELTTPTYPVAPSTCPSPYALGPKYSATLMTILARCLSCYNRQHC